MTPEQEKIWKDACNNAKKEKGYVPAELQMLPMMIGLYEDGAIDIGMNDDFTIIKSKEDNNDKLDTD
tara:strand:+ start:322 stop:522 length:201 start_codon:yes stop_codon:yes gene_type:complete